MRTWFVLLLLTLVLSGCPTRSPTAALPDGPAPEKTASQVNSDDLAGTQVLILQNVRWIDGLKTDVVIEGARIKTVGGEIPEGAEVRDCDGLTLLPGFIDAHVHLGFYRPEEVLAGGLTTVRDLGWDPKLSLAWQEASRQSPWQRTAQTSYRGPFVLAAGPMFTVAGGYPLLAGWAPPGTGRVFQPGAVKEIAEAGASVIKVTLEPRAGPTLDLDNLKQLVDEAHQADLKVTAHISSVAELEKALEAGVDELSHLIFDSAEVPQPLLKRMAEQVTVVPTLRVNPHEARLQNLGRFYKAGGRILYGTDLGNGGRAGIDVEELQLMQKAGMSPEDILRSATVVGADYLGLKDRGRIEAGAFADLLLVDGDPLKDFEVLRRPVMVIREGLEVTGRR